MYYLHPLILLEHTGMTGTITALDRSNHRGVILGADGKLHPFERETMVLRLQFDDLTLGMAVIFDVTQGGRALNVERPPLG